MAREAQRITAQQAADLIKPESILYMPGNSASPELIYQALLERAKIDRTSGLPSALRNVRVVRLLGSNDGFLQYPECFTEIAPFVGGALRAGVNRGEADFLPIFLKDVPWLFGNEGPYRPDVTILQVSPPDAEGNCTLGVCAGIDHAASRSGKLVIAEVNPRMPRVRGNDARMPLSMIDYLVEAPAYELRQFDFGAPDDVSGKIGEHIVHLIPNGATLQLGIGGIPDAVLRCLVNHKNLGIHSEMISDSVVELIKLGVITGIRNKLNPGRLTVGFIIGKRELYDFVHENDLFDFHRQDWVNDPCVIAQNEDMISINSAIEIDLTGQVCADSLMPKYPFFSGVGGQVDFVRGARKGRGGKSFIAMASTATVRGGQCVSKIVASLKPGSSVTTSRNDVHYVATEYGVACLYGMTIRERVRALIGLAHPDFREQLAKEAAELYKVFV